VRTSDARYSYVLPTAPAAARERTSALQLMLLALETLLEYPSAIANDVASPLSAERLAELVAEAACPLLGDAHVLGERLRSPALLYAALTCTAYGPKPRRVLDQLHAALADGSLVLAAEERMSFVNVALGVDEYAVAAAVLDARSSTPFTSLDRRAHLAYAALAERADFVRFAPTLEYLDVLARIAADDVTMLMQASERGHQWCRLLLAIRTHHALALEWLAVVSVVPLANTVWWFSEPALDAGVCAVGAPVMHHLLALAALAGNEQFIKVALALTPTLVDATYVPFSYTPNSLPPCPFRSSHACCDAPLPSAAELAAARVRLPAAFASALERASFH
jgi:hypothetical protein